MSQERILIVDDDEHIRAVLRLLITRAGYHCTEASEGDEALALARDPSVHIDLILLDVSMPIKDGYEVCESLRRVPGRGETPVIFLTARDDLEDKVKGLETGANDFITKPFERDELLARIKAHIGARRRSAKIEAMQKAVDEELKGAARVQRTLLPERRFNVPFLELAWSVIPSSHVGGDVFNMVRVGESAVAFYLFDISGHGIAAALVASAVSEAIRQLSLSYPATVAPSPAKLMEEMKERFPFERFETFLTCIYGVINTESNTLIYCNAGHPPAYLLTEDGISALTTGGPLIGIELASYQEEEINLTRGDVIVLYTDGLIESSNKLGDRFGEDKLSMLLIDARKLSSEGLLELLLRQREQFADGQAVEDDVSVAVLSYKGQSQEADGA